MYLIQLFLPLRDNDGVPFPAAMFGAVRAGLADAFGGVTAYQRAPATGLWEGGSEGVQRDDLVLFEVMANTLDRPWWRSYAAALADRFRQEEVLVRALPCEWL
jgi:hypothetical protein